MTGFGEQLREHWFAVARSNRIKGTPERVTVFGAPVVLVRDRTNGLLAFDDRCPHRGAPLSAGRLGPAGLICPYHGWVFGAGGRCVAMPGSPDGKPLGDVRVPAFHVAERDGLVWVTRGEGPPMPERIVAMDPGSRRLLWQGKWNAPVLEAQENFLDALHTHTVHAGLVRRSKGRNPVKVTVRTLGDGLQIDYEGQPVQSGVLFRLFESRRTRERAYHSSLSVAQLEYRYVSGWAAWITLCFTPETLHSTHVFATVHVGGRWAPGWLVRTVLGPLLHRVARQDQRILELQEATRQLFPDRRPVVTRMDITREYLEAAWAGQLAGLPQTRELTLQL